MTSPAAPSSFRTFTVMWATQTCSLIGSALTLFAISIWLAQTVYPLPEQKPALAFAISSVSVVFFLASMLSSPVAGVYADRYDRRRIMLLANLVNGGVSLLLICLMLGGWLHLAVLLPLLAINAVADAFHSFAFETSYVSVVSKDQLPRANGMLQTSRSLRGLIAPPLAALMVGLPSWLASAGWLTLPAGLPHGVMFAVGVDMVTFFVAAAVLVSLPIPSPLVEKRAQQSVWAGVQFGWAYIWQRRPLFWFLLLFAATNLAIGLVNVMNLLVIKYGVNNTWQAYGLTFEQAYALLGVTGAAGGLLGGVVLSAWGGLKQHRVFGVFGSMLLIGIGFAAYASMTFVGVLIGLFIAIFSVPFMAAHAQSIWQAQVPPEMQGRVFAVRKVVAQWTAPLGSVLAGALGGILPSTAVVAVMGALLVGVAIMQLASGRARRVEDRAYLEGLAEQAATFRTQSKPVP